MFADKACALIKELNRNRGNIPSYNNDLVNEVKNEIMLLNHQNLIDGNEDRTNGTTLLTSTINVRCEGIKRNVRCLLAYHYNRLQCLRTMRWEFGSVVPADIKENLAPHEIKWFGKYSSILTKYMRTIGEDGGLNLTVDLQPPKSLYVEVKCLVDYGPYELSDGSVLLLKKNSRHFLPRTECEELIHQGVFQHVAS